MSERVVIQAAGPGRSGHTYYPAPTLQAAVPLYEGVKVVRGGLVNGRLPTIVDVRSIIGYLRAPEWDEALQAITAELVLVADVQPGFYLAHDAAGKVGAEKIDGAAKMRVDRIEDVSFVVLVYEPLRDVSVGYAREAGA